MSHMHAIIKHLLSYEYGPYDRLLEFLVLALIAYEVMGNIWHGRRLRLRFASIFRLIHNGQELAHSVPIHPVADQAGIDAWKKKLDVWMQETHRFLQKCSPQAVTIFLQSGHVVENPHVAPMLRADCATLMMRLDNLRAIMEKPDVYF